MSNAVNNDYQDNGYDQGGDSWTTVYPVSNQDQEAAPVLSVDGERQEIDQLEANPEMSASARDELRKLQGKLNFIASETGDQQAKDLADIEAALQELTHPTPENKKALDEQITDYLADHPDLDDAQKEQLNKWVAAYQLDPEGTKSQITSEFKSFTQGVGTSEVYGDTISQLATVTGMKASQISDIFTQLQITDPENLSDAQIEQLLPKLGGKDLESARKQVADAQQQLQGDISGAQKQADKVNSDSDKNDFSSFKTLLDISRHEDPASLALSDAMTAEAKATVPILAALKGVPQDQITVMQGKNGTNDTKEAIAASMAPLGVTMDVADAKTNAGCLMIGGEKINVIGNPRTGDIKLSDHANAWPEVNLDEYKINASGKDIPQWVSEEGYPYVTSHGASAGDIAADIFLGPFAWF